MFNNHARIEQIGVQEITLLSVNEYVSVLRISDITNPSLKSEIKRRMRLSCSALGKQGNTEGLATAVPEAVSFQSVVDIDQEMREN